MDFEAFERQLREAPLVGSSGEAPPLYLSTSGGRWRVIYRGGPICADTTEERARQLAERQLADMQRVHGARAPRFLATWDGDAGAWK